MPHIIRPVQQQDLLELQNIIATSGLFPPEEMEGMMADHFANPQTTDLWFVTTNNNKAIAVTYVAPEKLTDGTYNMYLLAVHSDQKVRVSVKNWSNMLKIISFPKLVEY